MKGKKVPTIIMLLGGLIASICCIANSFKLLVTLAVVFVALVAFLIIGLIIDKVISDINNEVRKKEEEENRERVRLAKEQQEKEEEERRRAEEGEREEAPEDGGEAYDSTPQTNKSINDDFDSEWDEDTDY